ncbi:MAG TPA: glutamate--tRNA ligase [Candidatus Saccharimonadales bacterium]|nr:glutamate--tRNA ligase [Candidatus Saccharimonadales bacterium]
MKPQNNKPVRVRFAPSPTGHLHIGSLRTALFNWLFARHHHGIFLIRIEDTDVVRSTKEYEHSLLESLAWTGIVSDEPLMYQASRMELYRQYAQQLIAQGKAYKCYCKQTELQEKREETQQRQDTYQYDKACRALGDDSSNPNPYVVRFKVVIDSENFIFHDEIKGEVSIPAQQIDDFVLLRSDGTVTYNFANVIDDHETAITHVIRGEEHLFNTPKQILLYQAFGFQAPSYGHIPLILGPSGQKLSKRDGATSVVEYKNEGYLPQALCNYLVRLGWSYGDQEIFTQQEMIQHFSLQGINRSGAKFDIEKLKWVNSFYIKALTPQEIIEIFSKDLKRNLAQDTSAWTQDQRQTCISLYQDRVSTLTELYDQVVKSYNPPASYDWENLRQLIEKDAVIILQLLQQEFVNLEFEKHQLSEKVKAFCKLHNYKMSEIAQLLRFALTGSISGPSIFDMMVLLGCKEVQKRMSGVIAEF